MATALGAAEIEAANPKAWPAVETVRDGAWLARFPEGRTKRANSIRSLDSADVADRRRGWRRPGLRRGGRAGGGVADGRRRRHRHGVQCRDRSRAALNRARQTGARHAALAVTAANAAAAGLCRGPGFAGTCRYLYRRGQDQ